MRFSDLRSASFGRDAASARMRASPSMPPQSARTSSGAVTTIASRQFDSAVQCFDICSRTAIRALTSATAPPFSLGTSPLPAARFSAAATASMASDLPRRRCSRLGRIISSTS